ncbi:MAG: iron-containing alcohol dehydrogenase, partial [Deltaproteobacteria bacterium]|nr:iron-containing alcohol dehydrogenase [Deltaproteobacteria bacterium]
MGKTDARTQLSIFETWRCFLRTTCGAGSESTQFVVVQDRREGRKIILTDQNAVPAAAVLVPNLLQTLPASLIAFTDVDAVTHAVEALASRMSNPVGRAFALEALNTLVVENTLAIALADDDEIRRANALGRLFCASNLAGQVISTSMLGVCHAFATFFRDVLSRRSFATFFRDVLSRRSFATFFRDVLSRRSFAT